MVTIVRRKTGWPGDRRSQILAPDRLESGFAEERWTPERFESGSVARRAKTEIDAAGPSSDCIVRRPVAGQTGRRRNWLRFANPWKRNR